ncbi:NAD-dependent epimerase/dehydratase family protein [Alginatibacterium sediminis]|uniref:NAD-dependent epimerase/dehydratase family protein n=1 Tax=Alginatibacterium sediminis TaxID=2164068 RepID=A0A420EHI4_9ALTE|nr:NAD(P)H-binding protein [Alginatibacterium sediminis]RKF20165.1 NAD-dependent epimerase/dehydratase family protein [Alginatibacterium sediminis]
MKVLFIGGSGQISLACVHEALKNGHQVSVFNRGSYDWGDLPVEQIVGDLNQDHDYLPLANMGFDVVCQFMLFTPEQMQRDIKVFEQAKNCHYIFISSASAYHKPLPELAVTESLELYNPHWEYSRNKAAAEVLLQQSELLFTIVRPSHTLRTGLPTQMDEGFIVADRMLRGAPVIVANQGKTVWTITRSEDFAVPFVGLFANPKTYGEDFHITSDTAFTWDEIYTVIGQLLEAKVNIVHIDVDKLIAANPEFEGPLLGDKVYNARFDNSKVKSVVGDYDCVQQLSRILEQPVQSYLDSGLCGKSQGSASDLLIDRLCEKYGS